jgi:flagellar basal-body rod modification protein FlgD
MDVTNNGLHSAASIVANSLVPAASAPASRTSGAVNAKAAGSTSSTTSTASTAGTITANDFLTLLVTEMKNQDPTQPTDPNAYIQQLVGVNSLQQLISINQGLSTLETGATSGTSSQSVTPATSLV